MRAWTVGLLLAASCGGGGGAAVVAQVAAAFQEVARISGLDYEHGFERGRTTNPRNLSGGAAVGDFDGDGWVDLYVVLGDIGPNRLYRNRGDGTFENVAAAAGVEEPRRGCGPTFVDYDGDGDLDLFVGAVDNFAPVLYRNRGDGTFEDVTAASGLVFTARNTISAAFGDIDNDGDLDLFVTHWDNSNQASRGAVEHLWRNNGDGTFTDISVDAGIAATYAAIFDYSFTPNFVDLNSDGWVDITVASDFETSQVFMNNGDGTFVNTTSAVVSDENGMGAGIGDYDNDGHLDWFVSSIFDPLQRSESWGITGNRLYRNLGDGTFEDVTEAAGVKHGFWGWGSSFADLDRDGYLDIVHVNGWYDPGSDSFWVDDPTRVFMSNGDGTFTEDAAGLGIDDTGQGRGVTCFDYDKDGDVDLFIANNSGRPALFRNDLDNDNSHLCVRLVGDRKNTQGIGARIQVDLPGMTLTREVRCGNNYVSQNPAEAFFGLGPGVATVSELRVTWPGGAVTVLNNVAVNRTLVVTHP